MKKTLLCFLLLIFSNTSFAISLSKMQENDVKNYAKKINVSKFDMYIYFSYWSLWWTFADTYQKDKSFSCPEEMNHSLESGLCFLDYFEAKLMEDKTQNIKISNFTWFSTIRLTDDTLSYIYSQEDIVRSLWNLKKQGITTRVPSNRIDRLFSFSLFIHQKYILDGKDLTDKEKTFTSREEQIYKKFKAFLGNHLRWRDIEIHK